MGSKPRTSELDADPGSTSFGRVMTERMRPRLALSRASARHTRPGQLLRASQSFGMTLGLSHQNRRQFAVNTQIAATGASVAAIRPPIDYWPWTDEADAAGQSRAAARAAIVDRVVVPQLPKNKAESRVEALRRALMGPAKTPPSTPPTPAPVVVAPAVQRSVRRGLPLTPRRHGRTWAGPKTSPGGVATNAAPQATNSVSPTRFGGSTPEPLPAVARTGVSDGDGSAHVASARPAPAREERLRDALRSQGASPAGVSSSDTVSADALIQKYASAASAPTAAPARAAAPARPGAVLARTIAAESAPARAAAEPLRGSTAPTTASRDRGVAGMAPSTGRVSADVLRMVSPGDRPETRAVQREASPSSALEGILTPSAAAPAQLVRGTVATPLSAASLPSVSTPIAPTARPLHPDGTAPVVVAAESTDGLATLSVQPRWRFNPDNPDVALSADAARIPARLPLASRARLVHRGDAPAAVASTSTATLTRPDRRTVEPLQRTIAGTAGRPHAGWGPRHRHGLSRSANGQGVQWTDGPSPDDMAVFGGVAFTSSIDSLPSITSASALVDPALIVAPPAHRSTTDEPLTVSRAYAGQVDADAPASRPPAAARANEQWVSTERLVDVDRLPAPARSAPPLALGRGLQRVMLESNEMAAGLNELVLAPRVAGNAVATRAAELTPVAAPRVGTVPVTAAVMAEALRTVTQMSTLTATDAAKPARVTTPAARSTQQGSTRATAPDIARSTSASSPASPAPQPQHHVPARPGAMFSKLAGVSLLARRPLVAATPLGSVVDASQAGNERDDGPGAVGRLSTGSSDAPVRPAVLRTLQDAEPTAAVASGRAELSSTTPRAEPAATSAGRAGKASTRAATRRAADVTPAPAGTFDHRPAMVDPTATAAAMRVLRPSAQSAPMPAADLAERFLTELARHRQERPKPLPIQFASIADLIVGKRRPLISTSDASQRALAAVGKVAATTNDVIHLAGPTALSRPTPELTGIIAHELTHVAAPSPAPRFFADDRHSAEERRATEIGDIMRRSPAPPPSGSIATPGRTAPMTITEQHTRSASTGTVSSTRSTSNPSSSAGSSSGTTSRADTIHRAMASTPSQAVQRTATETSTPTMISGSGSASPQEPDAPITPVQFSRLLREHFDLIVELLEDRIGSDIERRGGRYRGGF